MTEHTLILGGASSGKSAYAERLALALCPRPAYIATAQAWDDEMRQRVAKHIQRRGPAWTTIEEPLALEDALRVAARNHRLILVDCLSLWLTNLMLQTPASDAQLIERFDALAGMLGELGGQVLFVSNEVGLGIVPENALARRFRDLAGALHQTMAASCPRVLFVAAGLALALKGRPAGSAPEDLSRG